MAVLEIALLIQASHPMGDSLLPQTDLSVPT